MFPVRTVPSSQFPGSGVSYSDSRFLTLAGHHIRSSRQTQGSLGI